MIARNRSATSPNDLRVLLGLWVAGLLIYGFFLDRWCISGDEYYTWDDSFNYSITEMLGFNSRPLYFIVCHFLLRWLPDWPAEIVIRLPAMLAASLIAPTIYGMLPIRRFGHSGLLAALIALLNPWVFQMSQFGRYYAFVIFFGTVATISALRWVEEQQDRRWPVLLLVAGLLAAVSHPPAVLVVPGGILAWIVARFRKEPAAITNWLKRYGGYLLGGLALSAGIGTFLLWGVITQWTSAKLGEFGQSSVMDILMSLAIVGGLAWWGLATLPLLRLPTSWSVQDVFLLTMLIGSMTPLLVLVPFGGGVAARYFLFCLPCMFLLAGQHWRQIDERLPSIGYRIAFGCAMFAVNVPYLLSIAKDGNHFDHRTVANAIEQLNLEDPLIFCSGRKILGYYLPEQFEIPEADEDDLQLFENGVPRDQISRAIQWAETEGRPLLLVARQDRKIMSSEDQQWLYERFAVAREVEVARYDHRRYRVVLYEYRPRTKPWPIESSEYKFRPQSSSLSQVETALGRRQ